MLGSIFFRIDDKGYREGSIIKAGRWGEVIRQTGERHTQFEREAVYEAIRAVEFPEKPSRLTASFVFQYWDDADAFHEWRWNSGSKQHMYAVTPVNPSAVSHAAFMYCMPPKQTATTEDIARSYWRGDTRAFGVDFIETSPVEIIMACDMLVKAVLTQD